MAFGSYPQSSHKRARLVKTWIAFRNEGTARRLIWARSRAEAEREAYKIFKAKTPEQMRNVYVIEAYNPSTPL
jgi:hypothetical protein